MNTQKLFTWVYWMKKKFTPPNRILSVILSKLLPIISVVDVGCGLGTWLTAVLKRDREIEILGIDGPWVNQDLLLIT